MIFPSRRQRREHIRCRMSRPWWIRHGWLSRRVMILSLCKVDEMLVAAKQYHYTAELLCICVIYAKKSWGLSMPCDLVIPGRADVLDHDGSPAELLAACPRLFLRCSLM